MEHGMRVACLAAFNYETSHALFNSNIETGEAAHLARVPAKKWKSVLVRHTAAPSFSHAVILATLPFSRSVVQALCDGKCFNTGNTQAKRESQHQYVDEMRISVIIGTHTHTHLSTLSALVVMTLLVGAIDATTAKTAWFRHLFKVSQRTTLGHICLALHTSCRGHNNVTDAFGCMRY